MKKIMFFCLLLILAAMPIQANTKEEVEFSKCTDGDTAHFLIKGKDTTVRFLAINAPEYTKTKEPYGKEASEYVCDILTNANTIELAAIHWINTVVRWHGYMRMMCFYKESLFSVDWRK